MISNPYLCIIESLVIERQKVKHMNPTEIFEVCDRLIDSGWKSWEVNRLRFFLIGYQQTRVDLPDPTFDMRRLEFLRYLVQTGRLADEKITGSLMNPHTGTAQLPSNP